MNSKQTHPVNFVSLGPGEAELITLKGLKALQSADIIFCPSTTMREKISSRAMDILIELGIDKEKVALFDVPMNKDRSLAIDAYNKVSIQIAEQYKAGLKIAVTAEGDAGFYSSVYYISENLGEQNIPFARIAGIPAFIASGTLANLHIVKQEEELNVVPGIISGEDLTQKIEDGKTVVIMKVSQCEDAVKYCLKNLAEADFHYFENVGVKDKEFYTTDRKEIEDRKFPYFSLMIIRK